MKASRNQKVVFVPVTLTLETQAEVDAIYAVLNHSFLCDVLGLDSQYECLVPFKSDEASNLHSKLNNFFRS